MFRFIKQKILEWQLPKDLKILCLGIANDGIPLRISNSKHDKYLYLDAWHENFKVEINELENIMRYMRFRDVNCRWNINIDCGMHSIKHI